jgi:carbon-monoxide dehydrogenase medium subunit
VKPVPFEYRRVGSVGEALDLLAEGGFDAKVLAGGQSFVPMLNMRILRPSLVIDINGISGLDAIEETNGDLRVGALCRQSALERSPLVRGRCPLLAACLPFVGHSVTRNRGTVGGSVAHADAAAELPLVLVTLGGTVVAESRAGRRSLPAEEFFVTYFTTALAPDELVVETLWPGASRFSGFAFEELAQRHGDYALSAAACALRVEDGLVAEARLAVAAVAPRPRLVDVPLLGRAVDAEAAREAADAARAAVEPSGHVHASGEYLRHVTGVLAERAVLRAWQDAGEEAA